MLEVFSLVADAGAPAATQYGTIIKVSTPKINYPLTCFEYIHHNPVKAYLVIRPEDGEFSSSLDYKGIRESSFVKIERMRILFGK